MVKGKGQKALVQKRGRRSDTFYSCVQVSRVESILLGIMDGAFQAKPKQARDVAKSHSTHGP